MLKLNRRLFVFSGIALAGCQTTGVSIDSTRVLTSKYDGKYDIVVGRLWNPTPQNLRDPYYRDEPESLAYLNTEVVDGRFRLVRVDDKSIGPNYEDFSATFYEGGILELSTTVGYLVSKASPYRMRANVTIGESLLSGEWVSFEPRGYDAQYRAHIAMRKVG
jgi:hypothetical protein